MSTQYVGKQWRTQRRLYLVSVVADSLDEAEYRLNQRGGGNPYAYIEEETLALGLVEDIHEDLNDGMGQ
jgi:hypothetical protein